MTKQRQAQELSYEEAREELVAVVRQLEQGGLSLDASVALWERGETLVKRCEEHLDGAAKRVDAVLAAAQGESSAPRQDEAPDS